MISRLRRILEGQDRWSINCDFHSWTVHDLSLNEAQAVLATLRDSEKSSVLAWKKGWADWKYLRHADCTPLLRERRVWVEAPQLPHADFDPDITAVRVEGSKTHFVSRKHERFEACYPVTIHMGPQEFKTETVDISEGGLRLRDQLPEWVAGYVSAVIKVDDGSSIEITCALAEDQKYAKTRLEIVGSEKQVEFLNWFRAHSRFKKA